MAFSPLGFSLPDLTITGSVGTRAAWGGPLGVIATVVNSGSSTITNPLAQAPGSVSTADAPHSLVSVLITPRKSLRNAVSIGSFEAPPISQNSFEQIAESFTLPSTAPRGFRNGKFFVHLVVNGNGAVLESNTSNDISRPLPVTVAHQALPELRATELSIAPNLQPGDTIAPTITLTNYGTAYSGSPIQVALVASTTPNFTVGSSIVALYSVQVNLPPASAVPPDGIITTFSQTANPLDNSFTFTGPAVTLPTSPTKYYLGVVIDPYGKIPQLNPPANALQQIRQVGPGTGGLPPAGVVSTGNIYPFPFPASGVAIGVVPPSTSSSGTGTTNSTIQ